MPDNHQVVEPGAGEGGPRRICPKCQSARVYRSHRRSRWENLQSWLGYYPFRCRVCDYRFTAKFDAAENAGARDSRPELRKRQVRRMVRHILVAGTCVVIFLMFLYYLAQPGRFGGNGP